MANCMQLEIVTPDKMLFSSEDVIYIGIRTTDGGMGIEANHVPVIASLEIAPLKYRLSDGTEGFVAVCGGFMEVNANKCTVLATVAELAVDIDKAVQRKLKCVRKSVWQIKLRIWTSTVLNRHLEEQLLVFRHPVKSVAD